MREFINKAERKSIIRMSKKDPDCCLIKLNGRWLKTRDKYYDKLRKKLQLNDTFDKNLNAYRDMLRDGYSYYNKEKIVFIIDNYDDFLCDDKDKKIYEKIFDKDIIPYFRGDIIHDTVDGEVKEIHVYCVI